MSGCVWRYTESTFQVVKDTFLDRLCSYHHVSSPCECGEPLNNVSRKIFEESAFDPLEIKKTSENAKIKALAVFVASIIRSLALAESVSQHGVYLNLG